MQSELLRKEGNETGPHKELEYWKVRSSVIDSIIEQLKLHKVCTSHLPEPSVINVRFIEQLKLHKVCASHLPEPSVIYVRSFVNQKY